MDIQYLAIYQRGLDGLGPYDKMSLRFACDPAIYNLVEYAKNICAAELPADFPNWSLLLIREITLDGTIVHGTRTPVGRSAHARWLSLQPTETDKEIR